jgi:adenine-specific DNA-methyltransferase
MLGNVRFPFPKPLPLVQALIEQCTGAGDVVLDFFAGSGTTAHAVLAQNEEDGEERRFILVSSTEATADEPQKNVCRDVCQPRLLKATTGYTVATKSGPKEIPGLGGTFAYFRVRRIPPAKLLDVDHAQVWTVLQLAHTDTVSPYTDAPFLFAGGKEESVCYVPRFRREDAAALREALKRSASVTLYSWQPQTVQQHIRAANVSHQPIPETLARRFGMNLGTASLP